MGVIDESLSSPTPEKEKLAYENTVFLELLEKYPSETHRLEMKIDGIDVFSCGEVAPKCLLVVRNAIRAINKQFPGSSTTTFNGIKIFIAPNMPGGGQALPRLGTILLDAAKLLMTVGGMEEDASEYNYKAGDQSRLVGTGYSAGEVGIVHELGHVLEFRAHGDVDKGFIGLRSDQAPTWYGQVNPPREDYAESWMYLVYGGSLNEKREEILRADILSANR